MGFDFNAYGEAWTRHDAEGVASYFTSDGTYEDLPLQRKVEGSADIAGFVTEAGAEFSSDYKLDVVSAMECGEGYVMEWVMKGTHDRSSVEPPLPATGKPYAIQGVSVGTFEGGKIKANRDYWDMAAFLTQIGVLPAPETASAA